MVSSAIVKFKKRFPETHVKVMLPDEPVMVMMDAMLVEQVLINILQNAQMHAKVLSRLRWQSLKMRTACCFQLKIMELESNRAG